MNDDQMLNLSHKLDRIEALLLRCLIMEVGCSEGDYKCQYSKDLVKASWTGNACPRHREILDRSSFIK